MKWCANMYFYGNNKIICIIFGKISNFGTFIELTQCISFL